MDKNRVKGAAKEASGSIKEVAGKLIGNDRLRAELNLRFCDRGTR